MQILFDQGTPVPLHSHLSSHEVATAFELHWSTLTNGDLLLQAEAAGFDPVTIANVVDAITRARPGVCIEVTVP